MTPPTARRRRPVVAAPRCARSCAFLLVPTGRSNGRPPKAARDIWQATMLFHDGQLDRSTVRHPAPDRWIIAGSRNNRVSTDSLTDSWTDSCEGQLSVTYVDELISEISNRRTVTDSSRHLRQFRCALHVREARHTNFYPYYPSSPFDEFEERDEREGRVGLLASRAKAGCRGKWRPGGSRKSIEGLAACTATRPIDRFFSCRPEYSDGKRNSDRCSEAYGDCQGANPSRRVIASTGRSMAAARGVARVLRCNLLHSSWGPLGIEFFSFKRTFLAHGVWSVRS